LCIIDLIILVLQVNDGKREIVFALAHNTIIRWDSDRKQILDVIQCEENSILYPISVYFILKVLIYLVTQNKNEIC
jgi:hypothetical protein